MHLVLLHALPLDGSTWAVDREWPVDSVVAPTLYGLGETLGDWADAVLDLVGPGPLVVAGISVGGSCALEVARRAPERIAALILAGTKPTPRPDPIARDRAVRVLTERGTAAAWADYWAPCFAPSTERRAVARARAVAHAQPVDDLVRGVRAFHDREDRADIVRDLPAKIVAVSGTVDRTPGPEAAVALAAAARAGELRLVDDCGHYLNLERPQEWNALLMTVAREAVANRG